MPITRVAIHPAIGVARVGDSNDDPYVGPETEAWVPPTFEQAKDRVCAIVKQAARFRVFAWDGATLIGELTAAQATITWTVHLANRKAETRNGAVEPRTRLVIDPGPRQLIGADQRARFETGRIELPGTGARTVDLGTAWTDRDGRLLVSGGSGHAESPANKPIVSYKDNPGWFDTVGDGPVAATVTVEGKTFTATGAWVVVGPPRFAPRIQTTVTLWDRLFDLFVHDTTRAWGVQAPAKPSYRRDIHPILERAWRLRWVNGLANAHFSFAHPEAWNVDNAAANAERARVANKLRGLGPTGTMPIQPPDGDRLTRVQLDCLRAWMTIGRFDDDWATPPSTAITPAGLDRAALDECVGAPFFPGIEVNQSVTELGRYLAPFRVDPAKVRAGELTAGMAVPWQADFFECNDGLESDAPGIRRGAPWWPAARPNQVRIAAGATPVRWMRGINSGRELVDNWTNLGFVLAADDGFFERRQCPPIYIQIDRIRLRPFRRPGPIAVPVRVPVPIEILTGEAIELEGERPRDRRLGWVDGGRIRVEPTGGVPVTVELALDVVARSPKVPIDQMVTLREVGGGRRWHVRVSEDRVDAKRAEQLARRPLRAPAGHALVLDRVLTVDDEEVVRFAVSDHDRAVVVVARGDDVDVELLTPIGVIVDQHRVGREQRGGETVLTVTLPVEVEHERERVTGPGTWGVIARRRGDERGDGAVVRVAAFVESSLVVDDAGEITIDDAATGRRGAVSRHADHHGRHHLRAHGVTEGGFRFERELASEVAGE